MNELYAAIKRGDNDAVALKLKDSPYRPDRDILTSAARLAISYGNEAAFRLLAKTGCGGANAEVLRILERGAAPRLFNVDPESARDLNPVGAAFLMRNAEAAGSLAYEAAYSIESLETVGPGIFTHAVMSRDSSVIMLSLGLGFDANRPDHQGYTALDYAIRDYYRRAQGQYVHADFLGREYWILVSKNRYNEAERLLCIIKERAAEETEIITLLADTGAQSKLFSDYREKILLSEERADFDKRPAEEKARIVAGYWARK